jgi:translation initiation factor IF-1
MGPATMVPLGAFRPKPMAKPVSGTGATAVKGASKIAVIHPTDRPRAASSQSPFSIATKAHSTTALETRSVGPAIQKDHKMPKEELLEFEGLVTEILPDARYRIELDNGHRLVAYTAGRMKKNRIKTLAGDRVTVEVSPYDLEKGRLIFRHKDERAGTVSRPPQRNQLRRR